MELDEELRSAPPATLDVDVCRALDVAPEFRDDSGEDDSPGTMVGHFSVFDTWYEINSMFEGNFLERIAPGAFRRTIKNRSGETPVRVLLEHGFDPTVGDKPLGVHTVLEERDGGAYSEVRLFDTSYNRDLAPALRAGAYGKSFRFQVIRDEWNDEPETSRHNPKGIPERTIKEVRLIEEGPTVFPASPSTDAGLRSTTDDFYERLRRRDPAAFDAAVARSKSLRVPARADDAGQAAQDPPESRHSEDPPADGHSEDPPVARHSDPSPDPSITNRSTHMDERMTIEERAARQSEISARLQELDAEFSGSEMTEEARSEWDSISDEYDAHERAITADRERKERIRSLAERQSNGGERVGTTPASAPHVAPRRSDNIFDLVELRQRARSIDELPSLMRDNAMRAIEQARFPGAQDRDAARTQVAHLLDSVDDDQGSLAKRVLATGSPVYDRAFGKAVAHGSLAGLTAEEQRALAVGTDSAGGFAVPYELDPSVILTSDGVADPLRQIARVEQITTKTWQGVTSAGVTIGRSSEAAESDDDAFTLGQPEVTPTRVDAFVPFSVEIEADWNRLRSEITMVLADAKMTEEANSFINGNGTDPNPQGLLTGTTSTQDVETATASTFADADLYAVEEDLPERWLANASWLAHRSFYNAVRQLGADSDGGNLWVRLASGLPPELIGYSSYRASKMPAFNAAGTGVLAVLGDFRQFLIVDRVGMNVELVPHVFGENQRPTGQRGIYAYWRNSCKVLVPGAFRRLKAHTT